MLCLQIPTTLQNEQIDRFDIYFPHQSCFSCCCFCFIPLRIPTVPPATAQKKMRATPVEKANAKHHQLMTLICRGRHPHAPCSLSARSFGDDNDWEQIYNRTKKHPRDHMKRTSSTFRAVLGACCICFTILPVAWRLCSAPPWHLHQHAHASRPWPHPGCQSAASCPSRDSRRLYRLCGPHDLGVHSPSGEPWTQTRASRRCWRA